MGRKGATNAEHEAVLTRFSHVPHETGWASPVRSVRSVKASNAELVTECMVDRATSSRLSNTNRRVSMRGGSDAGGAFAAHTEVVLVTAAVLMVAQAREPVGVFPEHGMRCERVVFS